MAQLCFCERCAILLTVPVDEYLGAVLDAALEAPVTAVSRDELHISLTRPTLLRKHDHESYVRSVAAALRRTSP